jgi:hypothetical protein
LDRANEDENFLKRIIIGDETRLYGYDVETKMRSSQWVGKIHRDHVERVKVMLMVSFDIEGVVHHEYIYQGQTVNRWYCLEVLKRVREHVRRKTPQLRRNNSRFPHHDNAPPMLAIDS